MRIRRQLLLLFTLFTLSFCVATAAAQSKAYNPKRDTRVFLRTVTYDMVSGTRHVHVIPSEKMDEGSALKVMGSMALESIKDQSMDACWSKTSRKFLALFPWRPRKRIMFFSRPVQ